MNKGLLHGKSEKSENLHAATLYKMIFRYKTVYNTVYNSVYYAVYNAIYYAIYNAVTDIQTKAELLQSH